MRGLIGKKLSHSFSKKIHEKIDHQQYNLIELTELDSFFQEKRFTALNVTIPYKHDVIKYLDSLSDAAAQIQVVNTITNRNGFLKGYNTDVDGLKFTLNYFNISVKDKVIGILGNGSTSRTIQYVSKLKKAKEIRVFARNPKDQEYHLSDLSKYFDIDILFNATPNGMFPYNEAAPLVDLSKCPKLEAVIDLIYNPLRTMLLIEAQKRGIKAVNGLMMLVHQAVKANEIFNDTSHPKQLTIDLYKEILLEELNLVLIGMPMSGKTYYAKQLSKEYNKNVIDIDEYIEYKEQQTIKEIFHKKGEKAFRDLESKYVREISKKRNKAISTGGGVILNSKNVDYLKQNGIIIFLDVSLHDLKKMSSKDRPLLKDPASLEKLFTERYEKYKSYCDVHILKKGFNKKDTLSKIEVSINEYIST